MLDTTWQHQQPGRDHAYANDEAVQEQAALSFGFDELSLHRDPSLLSKYQYAQQQYGETGDESGFLPPGSTSTSTAASKSKSKCSARVEDKIASTRRALVQKQLEATRLQEELKALEERQALGGVGGGLPPLYGQHGGAGVDESDDDDMLFTMV